MEEVMIEDGVVIRHELEKKLQPLAAPSPASDDGGFPHMMFFNGSGGAGKSVLLERARKVVGSSDAVLFAGTQLPAWGNSADDIPEQEPAFTGAISQWAAALDNLREQLDREAETKDAAKPTFPLFEAFRDRCIDTKTESERFISEWRWLVRLVAVIGFVGGFLAAIDWIVPIDQISATFASTLEQVLPGQGGWLRGSLGVFLALLTFLQLYAGLLTKGAFRVAEFFQLRSLFKKFGDTPRNYRERLRDEHSATGKDLPPDVLIRAFNFDLDRWIAKVDATKRIAIAVDVQNIPNNLSVREAIYHSVNTFLGQGNATLGTLRSRCTYILSSKYERMRLARDPDQSPYAAARKTATRVGFLAPAEAWTLVGLLLETSAEKTDAASLRENLIELHSQTDWRSPADRNSLLAERRLPAFLHAMAFGSLSAAAYFKSGRTYAEWHQTQAEYVRSRTEGFLRRHGHKTLEELLQTIGEQSHSFEDWLVLDFGSRDESSAQSPFERAFGSMEPDLRQALCFLSVFPHGLSRTDLTRLGFSDLDPLLDTRRIEEKADTKRVVAESEARQIVLQGQHFEEALPQLQALYATFEADGTRFEDAFSANVWGHTVACLIDGKLTEEQVGSERFIDRVRQLLKSTRTDSVSKDNRHLGAQICLQILSTFKEDKYDAQRMELRERIDALLQPYLNATPEDERSPGVRRIANQVDRRRLDIRPIFEVVAEQELEDETSPEAVVDHIDNTFALAGSLQSFASLQQLDPERMDDDLRLRFFRLLRKTGISLATREAAPLAAPESHRKLIKPVLARLEAGCRAYPSMAGDLAFLMVRTVTEWRSHLARHYPDHNIEDSECAAAIQSATAWLTDPGTQFQAQFDSDLWNDFGATLRRDPATKQPCSVELDQWLLERRRAFFTDAFDRYTQARESEASRCERFGHLAEALAVSLKLVFESEGRGWRVDPREHDTLRQEAQRARSFYLFFLLNQLQQAFRQQPEQSEEYREARRRFVTQDFVGSDMQVAAAAAECLLEVLMFANPQDGKARTGSLVVARPQRAIRRDGRWHIAFDVPNRALRPLVHQQYAPPLDWGSRWEKALSSQGEQASISGPLMLLGLRNGDSDQEYWPASARGFMAENSPDMNTRYTIHHVRKLLDLFMPLGENITDPDDPVWIGAGGSNAIMVFGGDEHTLRIARSGNGILIDLFAQIARLRRISVTGWGDEPKPSDEWFELEAKARAFVTSFTSRSDLPPKTPRQPMFIPVWDDEIGNFRMRTNHPDHAKPAEDPRALRTFNSLFKKAFFGETPIYEFDFEWAMRKEAGGQTEA